MSTTNRRMNPVLSATLVGLILASVGGLVYTVLGLAGVQECTLESCRLVYYAAFFAISAISVIGILRWKRWGITSLATAAGSVATIDLLQGASTMQDFTASLILIAAALVIMRPAWPYMD